MVLVDVNVLVYALREDAAEHPRYREWLETLVNSDQRFGLSTVVLSGVARVATHPAIFARPTPIAEVLDYLNDLVNAPLCTLVQPGARHYWHFERLCRRLSLAGNQVPDAWLAALAIDSDADWVTTDRGFARYPGLRCRHPLE